MTRRRGWLVGGIVAAAALAAAVWWGVSALRSPTPEEAARDYLRALETGDPEAVAATGAGVSETALSAFAGAAATIEDPEVTGVDDRGGDASVAVSFRLADEEHEARLLLTQKSGRWAVAGSGFGTVIATTTIGSAVQVGEAVLPAAAETALLPAVYPVSAAPSSLIAGTAEVVVLPGEDAATTVTAEFRPEATAAAQSQLEAYLETCTAGGSAVPENCGIRIPWGTEFREISDVEFRVEEYPVVTLSPTAFAADGGVLEATVTGIGQDGTTRTVTYRTAAWAVRGGIEVAADELALTVW